MNKRISNKKQIMSAYEMQFQNGAEAGKRGVLVQNGALEVFFNVSNALDILWVKYKGQNISFLSKNGLHAPIGEFSADFEGGFLYTCGLNTIGRCVENAYTHGTLHLHVADGLRITEDGDKLIVSADVRHSELFGEELILQRAYEVYANKLVIRDTLVNVGYCDAEYALLYHINFGYPFLDENLKMNIPCKKVVPWDEAWANHAYNTFDVPTDNRPEEGYYLYPENGVELINEALDITCRLHYSTDAFPVTWQWKAMTSGTYALGIEPATTTATEFTKRKLAPNEKREYVIEIDFS